MTEPGALMKALRSQFGEPEERVRTKAKNEANEWLADFALRTTFFVLGTQTPDGFLSLSPRGGTPGFLRVIGNTLVFTETRGNRLFESIRNLQSSPEVGLFLVVPGIDVSVRVYGHARVDLVSPAPSDAAMPPVVVWKIMIRSWYYHCGKAMRASGLFDDAFVAASAEGAQRLADFARKSALYDSDVEDPTKASK